jgi:hypothetical protein
MEMSRVRWAVAVLAAAGLLAGCSGDPVGPPVTAPPITAQPVTAPPAASTPAAPVPAAAGTPRCTTGELAASLGEADAGAGSVFRTLVFTNTGSRTCELGGFPGVSYVAGEDGHQVGPAAEMSGERGGDVRMGVGGTAGAQLRLVNVGNYDAAVCMPTPVRGLRIYPPGDTAALFVPMEGTGCAGTPPGAQLSVQTVTAR